MVEQKCRRILGKLILPVQTVSIQDPDKKDQVAYIDPTEIVELWLSQEEILDKLVQVQSFPKPLLGDEPGERSPCRGTNTIILTI